MQLWRLVPHHNDKYGAYLESAEASRIAIGWTEIGDLRQSSAASSKDIRDLIRKAMPNHLNAASGGASLWSLWREMRIGDLVIVAHGRGRAVFEVTGDYEFVPDHLRIAGYAHTRAAELTGLNGNLLWQEAGRKVLEGQDPQMALALCKTSEGVKRQVFLEGASHSQTTTARERNPLAREACIEVHGTACKACGLNFEDRYGKIGRGFIHVHHVVQLSTRVGEHEIDPAHGLVPLCANCHAMVHKRKLPFSVEELRAQIRAPHP